MLIIQNLHYSLDVFPMPRPLPGVRGGPNIANAGMPGARGPVPAPPPANERKTDSTELKEVGRMRKLFPETWLWTQSVTK